MAAAVAALLVLGLVALVSAAGASRHPRHGRHPRTVAGRRHTGRRRPGHHARSVAATGTPTPADVDRTLGRTRLIAQGGLRRRDVALTFDDGPGPWTPRVLAALARLHAPATFFLIGSAAAHASALVAREVAAGDTVGDHTESHAALGRLGAAGQRAEIDTAAEAIRAAGAPSPLLLRPPYGSFDRTTLRLAAGRRMLTVLWTVDTRDFSRPGTRQIADTALSGARPGAILLLHDGGGDRAETLAALPAIVHGLRRRGYRLVTLARMLAEDPPAPGQPAPPGLAAGIR